MTPHQLANMADFIAQQIHKTAAPDEAWADVSEDERNEFRVIAHAAMGAHDAWLTTAGYAIVELPKAKKRPKLIGMERPKLVGVH